MDFLNRVFLAESRLLFLLFHETASRDGLDVCHVQVLAAHSLHKFRPANINGIANIVPSLTDMGCKKIVSENIPMEQRINRMTTPN